MGAPRRARTLLRSGPSGKVGRARRHGYNSQLPVIFTGKRLDPRHFPALRPLSAPSPRSLPSSLLGRAARRSTPTSRRCARTASTCSTSTRATTCRRTWWTSSRSARPRRRCAQQLGTPLVVSLFRDNRWDYVYEFTRQGVVREHRTFTVYFVDDKLARWEGDEMPISIAELNKSAAAITAGEGAWSDPRSWWEQFLDIFKEMTPAVRIAVAGAGGKMGQALIEAVLADSQSTLAAAFDVAGSAAAGRDAGERFGRATGVTVGTDVDAAVRVADVLIDFTRPEGHARASRGVRAPRHRRRRGHDGLHRRAEGRARPARARDSHRLRAEHERRRQRAARARRSGRAAARLRLRHRDRRDASPAQGRRAVGHGARLSARRRRGARAARSPNAPSRRAKA